MANVIVFDGQCVLCRRWFHLIVKRDHEVKFKFCAMQTNLGKQLLRDAGLDAADPMSFLLLEEGAPFTDSDAMIRVLTQLGGGWRFVKVLRIVPRPIRDFGYRLIARNRYRMFGKTEECLVPTPELSNRFLKEDHRL